MKKKIAVFLSKNGADLQLILDACADYMINGSVDFVASSSKESLGLRRADRAGITYLYYDEAYYQSMDDFHRQAADVIARLGIDWIFMIEYVPRLPDSFLERFSPHVLGAYPSLKLEFVGTDEPGLLSAQKSLDRGEEETGCLIYRPFPGRGLLGETLSAERVSIFPEDDVWDVYNRVKKAEHYCIPRILAQAVNGELEVEQEIQEEF